MGTGQARESPAEKHRAHIFFNQFQGSEVGVGGSWLLYLLTYVYRV